MEKGLVSIITPCYNTAELVPRLLDSILVQDYPQLEMILVNDGSTDDTKIILNSYQSKFEARNITFTVLEQENSGQSVAINRALKLINGEFLLWPDSDDFYNRNDAVSLIVNTFNQLPSDYGMIKMLPKYVREKDLSEKTGDYILDKSERQFEQALFDADFKWGFYAIRVSALDEVNSEREIYTEKKAGQNWQIVLPVLYSFKCYTLEENVFSVLLRKNSHSRPKRCAESLVAGIDVYERTILNTLDRISEMQSDERESYKRAIRLKYAKQRLHICCAFAEKEKAKECIKSIINDRSFPTLKESVKYLLLRLNLYPFPKR